MPYSIALRCLFGYVGCGSRAAVPAIEMHDMRAGGVAAHGDHVHVIGGRHLGGYQGPPVDMFDPVHVLLMIFDGVNTVKRKG